MLSLRYAILLLGKYDKFSLKINFVIELVVIIIDNRNGISGNAIDLLSFDDKSRLMTKI
jgi:hypothetical protein